MSRLSWYSLSCCSKKPRVFASSRPAAAASWRGEFEQKTMRVLAARVGAMIDGGPMSQPTRHPVAANASDQGW